jgi:glycosyltransferase involved in cell wall biosynthesis
MKLVSVVITCYKDGNTIERAIISVLNQRYSPIEIVVVNDFSPETDLIDSIMGKYPEVIYVKNDRNRGLAASRNIGIALASGEYIAFLDADDEYNVDKIRSQMSIVESDCAVTCNFEAVPNRENKNSILKSDQDYIVFTSPKQIHYRNTLNGAGLLINKKLLVSVGCFDETLRSCEDFDLWLRVLSKNIRVKKLIRPLYFYYSNPDGLTNNFPNISKWEVVVIKKYMSRCGDEWIRSIEGYMVQTFWILKQIYRYESRPSFELYQQIHENIWLIIYSGFLKNILVFILNFRLLHIPYRMINFFSGR